MMLLLRTWKFITNNAAEVFFLCKFYLILFQFKKQKELKSELIVLNAREELETRNKLSFESASFSG